MRILVNTRLLLPGRLDGIGWFSHETLSRIVKNHPEHEFIFVFDRQYHPTYIYGPNVTPVVAFPQARHPLLFLIWFEISLPWIMHRYKPDLFLSPDGYVSLSAHIPTLAVIHDLNFEHRPGDLPFFARNYYRFFFKRFARKAKRIATVSEYSRQDISLQYSINPEKIDVVYNGASEGFRPLSRDEIEHTRQNYSEGKPYFLFVGSLHPRKNLINLFTAFDLFKIQTGSSHKLLIAGGRQWWTHELQTSFDKMKYKKDVVFTGRVSDDTLHRLTASAFALTYVSFFEGFGIPIIEAMQSGVPVITSNVTSMPEVAGDAALLANPYDPVTIATAMQQLYYDENLRQSLIGRGFERARLFSWDRSAELLWNSISKTMTQ
ncbi:MAG: glycosyltransferase family 4 protein [Bacteroidales bacterium]|nr:glycosyltransferase family 4 protein [Bacteroidales bacterium]NPV35373.1 glycosyltransferase family 4 protein [Bacteroidales bacterium]